MDPLRELKRTVEELAAFNEIGKTLTSNNLSYMYQWQDYLATQLPVEWEPNADYQLTEVASNLKGVTPQSPTLDITPENWYYAR